jgi:hypothetical protein
LASRAAIFAAMAFWVPMASIDLIAPVIARMSKSSGIALIALLFPSTARGFLQQNNPRCATLFQNFRLQ